MQRGPLLHGLSRKLRRLSRQPRPRPVLPESAFVRRLCVLRLKRVRRNYSFRFVGLHHYRAGWGDTN
jgi:hypothetical protein